MVILRIIFQEVANIHLFKLARITTHFNGFICLTRLKHLTFTLDPACRVHPKRSIMGRDIIDFFQKLIDSSDWPPRWHCGKWTEFHGWLYIISDLLIWSAYFSIPLIIIRYISKRKDIRFIPLYFLFAAFILACGSTHLLDAIAFWIPVYRFNALVRFITGALSWTTVFYLVKNLPVAFTLRSSKELEMEIEQRKKAETLSRESERQVQALFDAAPDAVIVINEEGQVVKWNPRATALFGWTAEDAIGHSLSGLIVPGRYQAAHQQGMARYISTGTSEIMGKTIELQACTREGMEIDVSLSISPTFTNGKRLFVGFLRDITWLKKSQEEIRKLNAELEQRVLQRTRELNESQQLLQTVVDNSAAVIYVKDLQGKYLLVNRLFCDLFHHTKEDIQDKTDYDIFSPEVADALRDMDQRAVLAAGTLKEEEAVPLDDGIHTYISSKSVLKDAAGRPYATFGISTDITELKVVESTLRKSLREVSDYKFALDESAIVAITDQKGIITHVNENFCRISKYSREELIGQDHRIINSGYHPKTVIRDLWVTIANGKIWKGELKNKARDGTYYWVDTTIVPFLNESGKPYQYVAIRADITHRKKVETEFHQLNEQLEDRIRLRTIELESARKEMESFAYSVSHDLRAPLRAIVGFTSILEEEYAGKLDEEGHRITSVIKNNTLKMGRLIDDLLAFSRMGKQEIVKTDIDTGKIVREIIEEQAPVNSTKDIEWTVHPLPIAYGDVHTIRQVWVNLISNAIKYAAIRNPARIEIGHFLHEGQLAFFVKDNGVGFDNKYKHKLFRVFQRLHSTEEFEGTGVGLALVEKIVSKHGGQVWGEGELGKGARFCFSLPVP